MIGRSEILAGGALSARWTARRLPPVLRECGIAQKYSAWAQVGARSQHYILWLRGHHAARSPHCSLVAIGGPALASEGRGTVAYGNGLVRRGPTRNIMPIARGLWPRASIFFQRGTKTASPSLWLAGRLRDPRRFRPTPATRGSACAAARRAALEATYR